MAAARGPRPPVTFHSTHTHFLGQLESHVLARCRRRRCWQVGRPLAARKSVLFSYLPIFFLGLVYFASFVIVEILQQCGSIWLGHFCSDNILNPVICHLVLRSFFFCIIYSINTVGLIAYHFLLWISWFYFKFSLSFCHLEASLIFCCCFLIYG